MPPRLDALLLESLRRNRLFGGWPLVALLRNTVDFFALLQERWTIYLAAQQPAETLAREPGPAYDVGELLPFDEPNVRAYVDTLFLEGKLKPVSLPQGWFVEGWAQVGVDVDERSSNLGRFAALLEYLERRLPPASATHRDWMGFAGQWAELTVLRHRLIPDLAEEKHPDAKMAGRYDALHLAVEHRFADWMFVRYHNLHSLPFLPIPVMVHRIPDYMAACRSQHPGSRQALVIVDGLALDQWLVVRDVWSSEARDWTVREGTVFAWVPTLTPISRQATFAGTMPQFFPDSWQSTGKESSHWQRFWCEHGLHAATIGYLRNLGVQDIERHERDESIPRDAEATLEQELCDLLENPRTQVVGLVVNTVDNIMHGMQLGTAGMHQQVRLWLTRYRYLTKLVSALLDGSFTVYLTSDHGNVWARGIGHPSEGVLVDRRGERARIYTDPAFLALARRQSLTAIEWTNVGLPAKLKVLLAPQLDAFLNARDQAVCHGGIALEEVIVPFVEISRK